MYSSVFNHKPFRSQRQGWAKGHFNDICARFHRSDHCDRRVARTQWRGRSIVPGRTIADKRRFHVPRRIRPKRKSLNSIWEHIKQKRILLGVRSRSDVFMHHPRCLLRFVWPLTIFKKLINFIFVE